MVQCLMAPAIQEDYVYSLTSEDRQLIQECLARRIDAVKASVWETQSDNKEQRALRLLLHRLEHLRGHMETE